MSTIEEDSLPTLDEVKYVLKQNPGVGNSQISSSGDCGRINRMLQLDLEEDFGVESELVITYFNDDNKRRGHMYLEIYPGELADVDGTVIVDGALDQFASETVAGDRNLTRIPPLVVAKAGEPMFDIYSGDFTVEEYLT